MLSLDEPVPARAGTDVSDDGHTGFKLPISSVRMSVYVPRYYDPRLDANLLSLEDSHDHISLGELVKPYIFSFNTTI